MGAAVTPAAAVAYALFALLAVWLMVRASLHALVGLSGVLGEHTLNGERVAVAAMAGALLAVATAIGLAVGTLLVRLATDLLPP